MDIELAPTAATGTATDPAPTPALDTGTAAIAPWPVGEVLREISRGGLAGLIVGLIVAGLGGRLVMRLAALLVPASTGSFTENGNRIGEITVGGSLALIVFVGLLAGIIFGVVWVVISPWLPGSGVVRGLIAMPIAVAFGAFGLIDAGNSDFVVLGHVPLVVASLIGLVALSAPAMALAEGWLDRRLPHPASSRSMAGSAYVLLTVIGVVLGGLLIFQAAVGSASQPLGITIILVGIATLAWWYERALGESAPSRSLTIAARSFLVVGTVIGFTVLIPEVQGALGLH